MNQISCEELKKKMERHENFKLVNALEPEKFRAMHIPHSVNVFHKEDVPKVLQPEEEIVVYCTDDACNKSVAMYYLLESLGYTKLYRFPGGHSGMAGSGL
jgi:rhodanese-related sulfurtransferase